MNFLTRLAPLLDKINALSQRERMILFALAMAAVWAVLDGALLGPQHKARQVQEQRLQAARDTMLQSQEILAARAGRPDPDTQARQRLEAARLAFDARMATAAQLQNRMVAPRDMVRVLQGLMAKQPGLRLVSLNTAPPEPVGLPPDAAPNTVAGAVPGTVAGAALGTAPGTTPAVGGALYRHGVTLTLAGDYAALTRYLTTLEQLPVGFYWARAELDASRHPVIELTLTLHTLSLESTWLTV